MKVFLSAWLVSQLNSKWLKQTANWWRWKSFFLSYMWYYWHFSLPKNTFSLKRKIWVAFQGYKADSIVELLSRTLTQKKKVHTMKTAKLANSSVLTVKDPEDLIEYIITLWFFIMKVSYLHSPNITFNLRKNMLSITVWCSTHTIAIWL